MQKRPQKRSIYFAWLLLLTLCLQRIIGYVGSEYAYAVEVDTFMDRQEQMIADRLRSETGAETQVDIVDEQRIAYLHSLGYVTPFLFSEEVDESSVVYTVDQASKKEITYCYDAPDEQPTDPLPQNRTFNNQWFPDFCFGEAYSFTPAERTQNLRISTLLSIPEQSFMAIPSPPPKWA